MIVSVVMSSATRAPATSLSLSTLFLHPTTYRGPLLALTMSEKNEAEVSVALGSRARESREGKRKGKKAGARPYTSRCPTDVGLRL